MSRDNITAKSILLMIEQFYGYGEIMRDELLRLGAKSVYLKKADFIKGSFRDGLEWRKVKESIRSPYHRSRWTRGLIKEIEGMRFDTFFIVENMPFKKYFLSYIREINPNIRIVLFLWDTFRTQQPHYFDYLPLFDTVYSFDRDDADKYGLRYYPDFYIDKEVVSWDQCKYDLSFVGAMNSSSTLFRGELLRKVQHFAESNNLFYFFYLRYNLPKERRSKLMNLRRYILFYKYLKEIRLLSNYGFLHSDPIRISKYNEIMADSRVILDLNHRNRQGLTINAITALALGKKLITTNKRIKEEPFYDPSMIHIIDDNEPRIDVNFFKTSYQPINMSHLRMDNWLKHIVNEN